MLWLLIPMFPILVNVFIDAFINLAAICVRVYALFVKEPSNYPSGKQALPCKTCAKVTLLRKGTLEIQVVRVS